MLRAKADKVVRVTVLASLARTYDTLRHCIGFKCLFDGTMPAPRQQGRPVGANSTRDWSEYRGAGESAGPGVTLD